MTPIAQKEYGRLVKSFKVVNDNGYKGCEFQMFVACSAGKASECKEVIARLKEDGYWFRSYGGFPYDEDEFTSIHWTREMLCY